MTTREELVAHPPGRISRAQLGLLRDIAKFGEIGPDGEYAAGCHGAAFDRVLDALYRKGLVELKSTNDKGANWTCITDAGRALAEYSITKRTTEG